MSCCSERPRAVAGFAVVSDALSPEQQLHWAHVCMADYSTAKHTNLYAAIASWFGSRSLRIAVCRTNLMGPQPDLWRAACTTGDLSVVSKLRWCAVWFQPLSPNLRMRVFAGVRLAIITIGRIGVTTTLTAQNSPPSWCVRCNGFRSGACSPLTLAAGGFVRRSGLVGWPRYES